MTSIEDNAKALGRLEGSLAALVGGVSELKVDLIDRIDTEARQREQTAMAGVTAIERLERVVERGLTTIRVDLMAEIGTDRGRLDDHEGRIVVLEHDRARQHWLRELVQPWRALLWTSLGATAVEGVHLLIT